jgi:K+-sensing histidine kinase KdpD
VAGDTLNTNLKLTQHILDELLRSSSNLSSAQQQLLISALDHLTHISADVNTVFTELIGKQQELTQRIEQEQAVGGIAQRIHQSLNSQEIFHIAATGVQQLLASDRTIVHRLHSHQGFIAIAENSTTAYQESLDISAYQNWLTTLVDHLALEPYVVTDIRHIDLPGSVVEVLQRGQVKGLVVVPIVREGQTLGTISVHQCSDPRLWQPLEIKLLKHLADQVAIALQQSELYQQVQHLNADRLKCKKPLILSQC